MEPLELGAPEPEDFSEVEDLPEFDDSEPDFSEPDDLSEPDFSEPDFSEPDDLSALALAEPLPDSRLSLR